MKKLLNIIGQRKNQLTQPLYPQLVKAECEGQISVFEVTNQTERYRAEFLGGEYEYLSRVLDRIEPGDVFWDVGANIGVFSIFAARTGASVHAFEPDPGFSSHLRSNVELNGQSDTIVVHELALSNEEGKTTLFTNGVSGRSPSLSAQGEERKRIEVSVTRGDKLDCPAPDVVKMDIEGGEGVALPGLERTLSDVRVLALEVHPEKVTEFGRSTEDLTTFVEEIGFVKTWSRQREAERQFIYRRED